MNTRNRSDKLFHIIMTALLVAIIAILQYIGGSVKLFGTNINLTLIPIVVGAITMGCMNGAALGFISGALTVIFGGILGGDIFTATLFSHEPFFTAAVCIVKTTLAGLVSGFVWSKLKKKNETLAVFTASALAPVVNTSVFIVGGLLFFGDALSQAGFLESQSLVYFIVVVCALSNFLLEFATNIILSPAIKRIITAFNKK